MGGQVKVVVAALAALALLSAACTPDDGKGSSESRGGSDATVTISGPETGSEADGFTAAFAPFTKDTGIRIDYSGSRDFETELRIAAASEDLPDLAVVPQPGLVRDLEKQITPVPKATLDAHEKQFNPYLWELVTVDGKVLGVPNKVDVKSLVWYSPKLFTAKGYAVPKTWDELIALGNRMKGDGIAPWCVGIESADATGWPLTDWIEDVLLRLDGPEVYDQWVDHRIPFDDPKVEQAAKVVEDIWFTDGNVLNGRPSIASTGFRQAGLPVADGRCGMYRLSNFYAGEYKSRGGLTIGETGDVNVFYLPTMSDRFGKVMLAAGSYVVAFNDDERTLKTLEYLAGADYADNRNKAAKAGFLSPNRDQDTSLYADAIDRTMVMMLLESDQVRFDASDNMPSEVGAGTFWKEGTSWVAGTEDLQTFLANVEASWPTS